MGERSDDPSLDKLRTTVMRWGTNPVHPGEEAYKMKADGLSCEMEKSASVYTNSKGPAS